MHELLFFADSRAPEAITVHDFVAIEDQSKGAASHDAEIVVTYDTRSGPSAAGWSGAGVRGRLGQRARGGAKRHLGSEVNAEEPQHKRRYPQVHSVWCGQVAIEPPRYDSYQNRAAICHDIFSMERLVREIARELGNRPHIFDIECISWLLKANRRVDGLRIPPCTYYNCSTCEYGPVLTHPTRGGNAHARLQVTERAHICAVCFAQGLIAPHRAKDCPLLAELDNAIRCESD